MPYLARSLSELAARGSETAMNYLNRPAGVHTDFYTRGLGGPALLLSLIQLAGRVRARRCSQMAARIGASPSEITVATLTPTNSTDTK